MLHPRKPDRADKETHAPPTEVFIAQAVECFRHHAETKTAGSLDILCDGVNKLLLHVLDKANILDAIEALTGRPCLSKPVVWVRKMAPIHGVNDVAVLLDLEEIALHLDPDQRENIHAECAPCPPQQFLERYISEYGDEEIQDMMISEIESYPIQEALDFVADRTGKDA